MYNADPSVLYTSLVTIRITHSLFTMRLFAAPYIYTYRIFGTFIPTKSVICRLVYTSRLTPTRGHTDDIYSRAAVDENTCDFLLADNSFHARAFTIHNAVIDFRQLYRRCR
jgi:hypothetical protein